MARRETLKQNREATMSFMEHLEELRRRLFLCALAVIIGASLAFLFHGPILEFLLKPLPARANLLAPEGGKAKIAVTGIGEGFAIVLKLSIAAGIAVASPVWVYHLWGFISPAISPRGRRGALSFTLVGLALFAAGLAVGYVTLQYPMQWLLDFGDPYFVQVITADNYFTFVAYFVLAFGITFELPLVLTFLSTIGVVSLQRLRNHRMKILVGLWIASCFIVPGADPYSPVILGVAFTVLYFISEGLVYLMERGRRVAGLREELS